MARVSEDGGTGGSYRSIGEVLSLLQDEFPDITISKIRFLESQGLLDPERTPSGYRKFYEADIERLQWILDQQRENFLPLKVIKERLESGELDGVDEASVEVDSSDSSPNSSSRTASETGPPGRGLAGSHAGNAPGASTTSTSSDEHAAIAAIAAGTELTAPTIERNLAAAVAAEAIPAALGLSRDELAEKADLTLTQVADLERFGFLVGRRFGSVVLYDEEALSIARLAKGFLKYGIEGRHLRMYRTSAEREAAFLGQVAMPILKQRGPEARAEATQMLEELARFGDELRGAMLSRALRELLSGT